MYGCGIVNYFISSYPWPLLALSLTACLKCCSTVTRATLTRMGCICYSRGQDLLCQSIKSMYVRSTTYFTRVEYHNTFFYSNHLEYATAIH